MKKTLLSLLVVLTTLSAGAWEYEMPEFEWSVGTDLTSAYLYRGKYLGGLSLQPDLNIGYAGVNLDLWFNVGTTNWLLEDMYPEFDLTLSYSIAGLTLGVNHQFYFVEGQKYFDFHKMTLKEFDSGDPLEGYNTNITEVFAKYNFGELFEEVPLTIGWYTYVTGDDAFINDKDELQFAYSTYIKLAYDWEIIDELTLTPEIGLTPWKGYYTNFDNNFAVSNIQLKLNWERQLTENFSFSLWAMGSLNPNKISKDNLIISSRNEELDKSTQRLNGAIGIGFYFN